MNYLSQPVSHIKYPTDRKSISFSIRLPVGLIFVDCSRLAHRFKYSFGRSQTDCSATGYITDAVDLRAADVAVFKHFQSGHSNKIHTSPKH